MFATESMGVGRYQVEMPDGRCGSHHDSLFDTPNFDTALTPPDDPVPV